MDAGISTTGLRVAGVPIGNDEWVQQFVQEKAVAVQVDVGKLDIISDGLIHYQMLRFCQNTRLAFLGRNTPTPLISDIFAKVDATILEALCRKGTTDAHGEWTAVFRRFVDMKLQLPHFRGGFGVTPNAGSAISAFYAASVSLVQWLGFCSHAEQNFIDLARTWAPGQDLANLDNGLPLFCLLSSKLTKSSSQTLVVMNGLLMGQLLPRQFRKSRARAQILLLTFRSLHLATSSHL